MIRNAESGSWRRMSQFHLLTDDEITSALSDGSTVIRAVSFDRKTKYAAVELPNHSPYLEISAFRKLLELLASLGLKPRIYTASGSKDVQLFLFFTQDYKCSIVQESLTKVLSWNGFSLRADRLVVYPSDVALPLPLQRGFVWLNEDLQPIVSRTEIALDSALALFCSEATRYATEFERVIDGANLLPSADITAAEFWGLNPNKVEAEATEAAIAAAEEEEEEEAAAAATGVSTVEFRAKSAVTESQSVEKNHVDGPIVHYTETGSFVEIQDCDDDEPVYHSNVTHLPFGSASEPSSTLFTKSAENLMRESMELDEQLEADDELDNLDDILEQTTADPSFNFASLPENEPAKTESLKAFPLWLVEDEVGVEVFPVPADQEALEEMIVEDGSSEEEELEQVAIQGEDSELWPRQNSQLLLLTNEPAPDVQLDLFSRKNLNRGDQQVPRSKRKRTRFEEPQKPEE